MAQGKKADSRVKLTDGVIRQQQNKSLSSVNHSLVDSELVGFQIRRVSKAKLSFRYEYRLNGKRRIVTLGQWPKITVAQARTLAKEKALSVANSKDPLLVKQQASVQAQNTLSSYLKHDYGLYMKSRAIEADKYLNIIRNGFPELLSTPLVDISKTDLVKWVQAQTEQHNSHVKGYASATIIQRHGALKSLMSHALRNGVIKQNPFDLLDKLEFSTTVESTAQQAKRTYLSIEQQQAFLQSVDNYDRKMGGSHHKPMMLILYYMGMRTGDVVSLEWSHIIDTPFTQNITKVLEKTRRKIKTPFVLPMPEPVTNALREWRKQQGNTSTGLVFPSTTGGKFSKSPLRACWEWVKKDAGFHHELELYTLRHNFISWLSMDNTPLPVIADMVGHNSTDMINRNYGHLVKGATTEASNGFSQLLDNVG